MNFEKAVQYRINRLREQIEEDLAVRAEGVDLVTFDEFNSNAPEYLKSKSQQNSHDQHLARLEYELMQRKEMNSSLKTKQVSVIPYDAYNMRHIMYFVCVF